LSNSPHEVRENVKIAPAVRTLGIFTPRLSADATTILAGVEQVKQGPATVRPGNGDAKFLEGPISFTTKNYYPPRGNAKEDWGNIDNLGWLGYPMQIKVDVLRRDSILAAPPVLDQVLFLDLAQRAGMRGEDSITHLDLDYYD